MDVRHHNIYVRLTDTEFGILSDAADAAHAASLSEFIRNAAMEFARAEPPEWAKQMEQRLKDAMANAQAASAGGADS